MPRPLGGGCSSLPGPLGAPESFWKTTSCFLFSTLVSEAQPWSLEAIVCPCWFWLYMLHQLPSWHLVCVPEKSRLMCLRVRGSLHPQNSMPFLSEPPDPRVLFPSFTCPVLLPTSLHLVCSLPGCINSGSAFLKYLDFLELAPCAFVCLRQS